MTKAFVVLAISGLLAACAPYPPPVAPTPGPVLVVFNPALLQECRMIRIEIARQQRIAALSPVMETWLVEGAARLNTHNVVTGLRQRAAIEGCPV